MFLCVLLLEAGLRIGGFVLLSLQEYRNRILMKQKSVYRIMCVGESTTAGGEGAYPAQLQEILNQRNVGIKFIVMNKGKCAIDTSGILLELEENFFLYRPDMVIAMMGINDGGYTMKYGEISFEKISFLKSLRTYKLAKLLRLHIINKVREIGFYKSRGKKEDNHTKINRLIQPIDFKEKEEMLKKAIEINPKNPQAYVKLGRYYRKQGKYNKAKEILRKAIDIDSKNYRAYVELGWCYSDQKEYDGYEEMFKKAVETNPEKDLAYTELGACYKYQQRYDKAEEVLKKAIKINPKNDQAYAILAHCYREQGKYELAKRCFQKANILRLELKKGYYTPITKHNYNRLKEILTKRKITLVCVQYPMRSVGPLKKIFEDRTGIIFVDNEAVFKEALGNGSYGDYFEDMFVGDFGHCTYRGNRLLAENIANVILKEYFGLRIFSSSEIGLD